MEQMQQFNAMEAQSESDRMTRAGNMLQLMLADKHGEDFETFLDQHAADFRDAMNAHPEYVERFERDPEGTLQEIEKMIYH